MRSLRGPSVETGRWTDAQGSSTSVHRRRRGGGSSSISISSSISDTGLNDIVSSLFDTGGLLVCVFFIIFIRC